MSSSLPESLSLGFKDSPSSRSRWTQVTRMIRPPGLHTRCISDMNLTSHGSHFQRLWTKTHNLQCTHAHSVQMRINTSNVEQFDIHVHRAKTYPIQPCHERGVAWTRMESCHKLNSCDHGALLSAAYVLHFPETKSSRRSCRQRASSERSWRFNNSTMRASCLVESDIKAKCTELSCSLWTLIRAGKKWNHMESTNTLGVSA